MDASWGGFAGQMGTDITASNTLKWTSYNTADWDYKHWLIEEDVSLPYLGYQSSDFTGVAGQNGSDVTIVNAKTSTAYNTQTWNMTSIWTIIEGWSFPYLRDFSEITDISVGGVNRTNNIKKNSLRISKSLENNNYLNVIFNCKANDWIPRAGEDIKFFVDGVLWFGGVISKINKNKIDQIKSSEAYTEYSISSDGYYSICQRRTVSVFFDNKTAGYIFEWLIDNVLNLAGYSEGITKGDITAGMTFDRYGAVCKSVKEIYDDIAKQSGVQWNIDDTKKIEFVSEKTVSSADKTIDVSGSFTDYKVVNFSEDLTNYCNKVFVKGENDNFYATVTDSSQITERVSIEGSAYSSGVYGKVITADSINDTADLTTIGENELKKYSFLPINFQIKSSTSNWTVGSKVQCYLPDYGMTANMDFIVEKVDLTRVDNIVDCYVDLVRRNSADFSTQKEDKGLEFMRNIAKKFNGFKVGETGILQNSQQESTANFTIGTAETTVVSQEFTLKSETDFHISFSAKCEVTAATTITANTKIIEDGVTSSGTYYPTLIISSEGTLNYGAYFNNVTANATTIYVTLTSDGNDVSVDTANATMTIIAMPQYL